MSENNWDFAFWSKETLFVRLKFLISLVDTQRETSWKFFVGKELYNTMTFSILNADIPNQRLAW